MEEIIQLVGNLGFPIAPAAYLMIKMNATIEANTAATNALSTLVEKLFDRVNHLEGGNHND